MRRVLLGVVAALAAVLMLPTAAWADAVVTFESPTPDQLVSEPTEIALRIERTLVDPHPESVAVQLSADGFEPHPRSTAVDLECLEHCEGQPSQTVSRWGGATLQPRTLAPFGDVPSCNGRWWLLPALEPGSTTLADGTQGSFLLAQPPERAAVEATVDGTVVDLTWRAPTEADIIAYRVERRRSRAATWNRLAELDADTRRFRDEPGTGRYEYRIVTLRPDGRVDGDPVPACTDRELDLATPSDTWTVSFTTAGGSATPTEGSSDEDEDGDGARDAGEDDAPATDGSDDAAVSAAGGSAYSVRDRLSSRDDGGTVTAPEVPTAAQAGGSERYFGQDGPFSEQLDYGDEPLAGEDGVYDVERISGGMVEIFDREIDLEHVLRPVAAGMVLIGFGLHLRRWVRASD